MKPKEIKELIDYIANSGLDEVNIETEELKLHIKRQSTAVNTSSHAAEQAMPKLMEKATVISQTPSADAAESTQGKESTANAIADRSSAYIEIKSPMIGTFYRSPNPESDAFVKVGAPVTEGQVVCIIEAMKLFNEIESEVSGKIVKVLVENASPVEYDQPLFLVDPS